MKNLDSIISLFKYISSSKYLEFLLDSGNNKNEVYRINNENIKYNCYEVIELPERLPDFSENGFHIIHISIKYNNLVAVKVLLNYGVSIISQTENIEIIGLYNYKFDLLYSNEDINTEIETNGSNPFIYKYSTFSPIHIAAIYNNDLDIIKHLIQNGADINTKNPLNYTPLILAAIYNNSLQMMEFLLSKCNESKNYELDGKTPLAFAIRYNNKDIIQIMLKNNCIGENLYIEALNNPSPLAIFKILEQFNFDINEQNQFGETVFEIASIQQSVKILKKLIRMDVKPKIEYISFLLISEQYDVLQYWINNGLDINIQNEKGFTALHYIADIRNVKGIIFLLHLGADYHIKNTEGLNPLNIIEKNGIAEILREIIKLQSFI